jgi:hypothetical protein
MHLTEDSYRRLVHGTLTGFEARSLAAHLEVPCEACEAYLEGRPAADALDGRVDAVLLSLAAHPAVAAGHDLGYARLERALRRPEGGFSLRRWLPGVAVAAALAVAGLAGLLRSPAPTGPAWDGEKGPASQPVPLRLRFLVVTPGLGGPPALERGLSGQEAPAAASLQFEVELGRPAHVLLARVGAGGAPEVFLSTSFGAGRHVVSLDGRPAAYPLAALSGPQRFLALASEAPLGPADAARAVGRGATAPGLGPGREEGPAISLDEVEVRVRP